jgi:type II secretory pathway pseudopilin PulG
MKFKTNKTVDSRRSMVESDSVTRCSGFTLAEVLAAMVFMAIVIPVLIQALHVASGSGEAAVAKAEAARIAQNVLNESILTTNWNQAGLTGTISEGVHDFKWKLTNDTWEQDPMRLLTVEVTFTLRDKEMSVRLSTLVDSSVSSALPNSMVTAQR